MPTRSTQSGQPRRLVGIVDTNYYSFIDGLRGLAILMVVGCHAASTAIRPLANGGLQRLAFAGDRGVQLFFIVSAFTLFSTSLQRFPTERRPFANFYLRRCFRILPLWWLSLAYYFFVPVSAITPGGAVDGLAETPRLTPLLLRATFLSGFVPSLSKSTLNPGGWSLFVEESFYLFLPLLVSRVRSLEAAVRLVFLLIALSIGWHYVGMTWLGAEPLGSGFVAWFPFFHWYAFGLGIVLFFVFTVGGSTIIKSPLAWLLDTCAALFFLVASQVDSSGLSFYGTTFALALLALAASQDGSITRIMLDNPPVRLFGRCCFSIYLCGCPERS